MRKFENLKIVLSKAEGVKRVPKNSKNQKFIIFVTDQPLNI